MLVLGWPTAINTRQSRIADCPCAQFKDAVRQAVTTAIAKCVPLGPIWKHDIIHHTEVHNYNLLHFRQRRTEPWPQVTCTENFVKFGHAVFNICEHTDRHTHTYADCNTLHHSRGRSNHSYITSKLSDHLTFAHCIFFSCFFLVCCFSLYLYVCMYCIATTSW